jgi:hypothetical protein
MANTYTLISSNVLTSNAASVTFSSIPATYTDLVLRVSSKNATADTFSILLNSNTSAIYSYTLMRLNWNTTAVSVRGSSQTKTTQIGYQPESVSESSDVFGSTEIYIPNYTSTTQKPISSFSAQGRNGTTYSPYLSGYAGLVNLTSAVTSITVNGDGYNLLTGSSFYLYGIKNS